MQKLMGLVRRCVEDYDMIGAGDKIAVGVSGGKDSLALLVRLAGLRAYLHASMTSAAMAVPTPEAKMEAVRFSRVIIARMSVIASFSSPRVVTFLPM